MQNIALVRIKKSQKIQCKIYALVISITAKAHKTLGFKKITSILPVKNVEIRKVLIAGNP
ncbi:hypothetical protein Q766_18475 [Flavobacterium subsaxonicum WB 4.1-42 = DSM 21790]|uniref:Uncharacterized protein n=1 Tax=Flavobacterium subsaxonicum WB 4.1-42 = DSM 21790 TaxID=1121898 RepID=A0A0A2MFD1_9FLAO|nr:hypothetical protein Q766_18475 [Flavobacterium subsaxonicum WB 4.1-42 = DSM 21790]